MTTRRSFWLAAFMIAAASACVWTIGDGSGAGNGAIGASQPPAPLRRLSRVQYNNTVRDLLGDTSRPADQFLPEEAPGSFAGNAQQAQPVPAQVEQYRVAAEALAQTAAANLPALLPCAADPSADERGCARTFVEQLGPRAYRRPLTTDEVTGYLTMFDTLRPEGDFTFAVQALLAAMLQSPYFLYRPELAPADAAAGSVIALSQHEIAARLSYFIIDSMPDDQLFAAADAGVLETPDQIEAQARRLLQDPRAQDTYQQFFGQWLMLGALDNITKDPTLYPEFGDPLRQAMRDETLRFAGDVMTNGGGSLDALLTSPTSFAGGPLTGIYGLPPRAAGDTAGVAQDPQQRAGILTQASLMTITADSVATSPTRRGKFVRNQLLCAPPPPPPPNVDTMLPKPQPGQNARQRIQAHTTNPACASCHLLMDPIGFGFENYDPIGRFRTTENGMAVDASGQISGTEDLDGTFVGAVDLARRLAESPQVHECMVKQWFRFAAGRPEDDGDATSIQAASAVFTAAGLDMRELMVALTRTDAFRMRVVEVP